MGRYYVVALALTGAMMAASMVIYPSLPARVPIHWNTSGEANGFAPKEVGAFIGPAFMIGIIAIFRILPWLSPRSYAVSAERPTYLYVMVMIVVLMGCFHAVSLAAALGRVPDVGRLVVGAIMLFLALLGNVLSKIPRNFFIGIRTPWTLADERVWYKTHRLAGRLMVVAGVLGFFPVYMFGFWQASLALLGLAVLVPALYSLILYKRLERAGEL